MDSSEFKNIIGETKSGRVATIRFFGKITESSAAEFNAGFDFLENIVRPSLIRVLINSEGGSVLHGMGCYSTILNSRIPTECVIEGMAASMGSVLWAAGSRSLMRDYGILMIHNPFMPTVPDEDTTDMVQAFTSQIETIYRKRFALSGEHVRSIMSGEAGKDGTYFDAAAAVAAGIIPSENILHTSEQLCDRVRVQIDGIEDTSAIQNLMAGISASLSARDEINPTEEKPAIHNKPTPDNQHKQPSMNEVKTLSPEYSAVIASLGMQPEQEVKSVLSRISFLTAAETKLADTSRALSDAQTVIAGKDTAISNLQTNVTELTASLKVYQEKEALEKRTRNENMVNGAHLAGKIKQEDIPRWLELAQANPELVESTFAFIPAVVPISEQIADDPANIQAAADTAKSVEQKIAEKVVAVVGEHFEFKNMK